MLRPFLPDHALLAAPAGHGPVAGIGSTVAGFLVRHQAGKGLQRVQPGQDLRDFAHGQLQPCAAVAQLLRQVAQALAQELVVLQRTVRLRPQAGLQHVKAQHRAMGRRMGQRRMVMYPQVALEPYDGVVHGRIPLRVPRPDACASPRWAQRRQPMGPWRAGGCSGLRAGLRLPALRRSRRDRPCRARRCEPDTCAAPKR